jgi:UDP-glucose 4-epimerase
MATYLVTGGCGFIGSHLCKALVSRGDAVRVLDDLSTGSLANLPAAASFIRGDVADLQLVRQAMTGVDGCFHLAAVASVDLSNRDWLRTHRTNLTGAITVFDAAIAAGPVPVVYASSAAVYGNCPSLPLRECSEKQPLSAYGADKLGCELPRLGGWQSARPSFGWASSIQCLRPWAGSKIALFRGDFNFLRSDSARRTDRNLR